MRASGGLAELQDELVGPAADRGVEDVGGAGVVRVAQDGRGAFVDEAGGDDVALHRLLVDAVGGGVVAQARSGRGGVVDDDALLSVVWEGPYGIGRNGMQINMAAEGKAAEVAARIGPCLAE